MIFLSYKNAPLRRRTRIRGKKSQATMLGAAKSAPHKQSVDSQESAEQTLFYKQEKFCVKKH